MLIGITHGEGAGADHYRVFLLGAWRECRTELASPNQTDTVLPWSGPFISAGSMGEKSSLSCLLSSRSRGVHSAAVRAALCRVGALLKQLLEKPRSSSSDHRNE